MVELPNVTPLSAPGDPIGVRADIGGIRAMARGLEPGWYVARALLPRYNAWAEGSGHKAITAKALGEALSNSLTVQKRRAHGNVSAYLLDEDMTRPA